MSESDDIDALRAMDRPVTPPSDADERIRSLIAASIRERTAMPQSAEPTRVLDGEVASTGEVDGPDITAAQRGPDTERAGRGWSTAVVLQAAALVLVIVGLVVGLAARGDDEPDGVVAAGPDPVELTGAQRICAGPYARLGDLWREILDATTPGYAVDMPRDRHEQIVERQYAFLDLIEEELEAGQLSMADPNTLAEAWAAVDDGQATFDMDGSTESVATVGISHRLFTQLIEENPQLRAFCDPVLIAWPE